MPPELQLQTTSQTDLALYIDKHHDPLRIAQSIDRHGFFPSEPLIALTEGRRFLVVEGNRRLVALKGLADAELRSRLERQTRGWKDVGTLPSDTAVPVLIVETREEVEPLLGFRHISGIEPWDPFAQARFISRLVDRLHDFAAVAQIVGRSETEVRSMYRDHDIVEQAKSEFDLNTGRVEKSFGVFNAAMGLVKLRDYIGAPSPREVDPAQYPIPDENKRQVERLLEYLFGDDRGRGRVISDSRQLRSLARVLSDESGVAERALRQSRDLEIALEAAVEHQEGARTELKRAKRAIERAADHITADGFDARRLRPLIDDCRSAIDALEAAAARTADA